MAAVGAAILRAVANHVVLPPDLPGGVDKNLPDINGDLLRRAQDACTELKAAIKSEFQQELSLLESSLDYCYFIHTSAHLDSLQLQRAFRRLQQGEILIIHVNEQNAGLLVRYGMGRLKGHVIFEAFEVSAQCEKVLECKGALQWTFPTSAAAIPNDVFADEHFQQQLADFLERGSMENIKKFGAVTHKAQSFAFEPRDTTDPALITGLLITLLEGIGQLVSVPPISKRVKDEVRFKDAMIPWRRSPFWLLLRVGILRHLGEITHPTVANTLYKALMCLLQARLLGQVVGSQTPDLSHLLLRKLCRRMAKLEKDRVLATRENADASRLQGVVLDNLRPPLLKATKDANLGLHNAWESYKSRIQRRITPLRTRMARPEHLRLGLRNVASYLGQMRQHPLVKTGPAGTYAMSPALREFLRRCSDLTHTEEDILACDEGLASVDHETWSDSVLTLAESLQSYLSKLSDQCYEVGTVDRSRVILVTMWLWVLMDRLCCRFVPGFSRYRPVFRPQVVDCLLLSSYGDLCRLHQIQCYLAQRHTNADASGPSQTIFDTPVSGCFADCYFQSLDSGSDLHLLNKTMQEAEERRKRDKKTEWEEKDAEHQRITKELSAITCQFTFVGDLLIPEHDEYKCHKCILTKKADKIGIERIEQALPYNSGEARAALLELRCPKVYAACRNATWAIAATLGLPNVQETRKEPLTMADSYYAEFSTARATRRTGVTLASRTKSFLQTHFRYVHFPIPFEKVCVNNGLRFEYYDVTRKLWPVEHLHEITFGHHCWQPSTANPPMSNRARYVVANSDITSNEVLAGLPRCPQTLGTPEFMAFQGLLSRSQRLWPAILAELGSSNLNFSSEAVAVLLQALSCRTGRPCEDTFHVTNVVFRSDSFCNSLLTQIERRLSGISSNWRESYCMEVMLTLILKVVVLGSHAVFLQATRLVETVRKITLNWIKMIREELWVTINTGAAARLTQFIVWAALLCRRTFTMCSTESGAQMFQRSLSSSALVIFLEASIALQENLVEDPNRLPPSLRSMLTRDLKMVCRLQGCLRRSLEKSPRSLVTAAVKANAVSGEALTGRPTSISFDERPDGVWGELRLPSKSNFDALLIEYHLVGGALLLDGKPVERELPAQVRHADATARLFPNQRLIVYPSSLPGMTYKVAFEVEGQEVHFGFRQGELVIRVWGPTGLWEYIPSDVFERNDTFDLPASLIDGCVHWLDLRTNIVEVRRVPKIWRSAPANWNINLNTGMANRRQSTLLDPGSNLFHHFASVFRGFEDPRHITVYQPARYPLSVELRRYELTFFVNPRGLLECLQLRAELDENQDAGTWYGLSSKLVLRDVQNPSERSVIVPLAPLTVRRKGLHVDVEVQRIDPVVGRFYLDGVLGRVTCASEPRLFYTKALLHACTSFCLPDPLTGKTGADEACHILQTGACQPYAPLTVVNKMLLTSIADLTPKRQFYPEDLRVMETVTWRNDLTAATQDDRYWHLVDVIKRKSDLLAQFELKEGIALEPERSSLLSDTAVADGTNTDLVLRSQMRRLTYQRRDLAAAVATTVEDSGDTLYRARGYHNRLKSQIHVFEAANLLHNWPSKLPSPTLLHVMMQQWPHVGGYGDGMIVYDKIRLSDRLEADLASSWGPLVNLCRLSGHDTKYRLLFLLATISFGEDIDVRAIHTLIAFSVFQDLKKIDLPSWPSYTQFRPGFTPKSPYLKRILGSCVLPFATSELQISLTQKERKAVDAARKAHDLKAGQDLDSLAEFMCAQWPCALPDLKQFSTCTLDLDAALSAVGMEWHAMFQNHEFEEHLRQIQDVLDRHRTSPPVRTPQRSVTSLGVTPPRGFPSVQVALLNKEGPSRAVHSHEPTGGFSSWLAPANPQRSNQDVTELRQIVAELPTSESIVRQEYMQWLLHSIAALEGSRSRSDPQRSFLDLAQLDMLIAKAQDTVDLQMGRLVRATKKDEPGATWLDAAGLWPTSSRGTMLETLRSTSHVLMTASMRTAVTRLGVAITQLQRLLRIQDACRRNKAQQLDDELKNPGHTNWDPEKYSDWLLLEIDTNILIRPVQADVAFQIISPASGSNSVLQLNMGQGKTSTIIPLVASVLANGRSLCRVVVPKALLLQTAQLLQSRLGGLLGRELRHVPFSRRTPYTADHLQAYAEIHGSILKCSGVIIALPEHLMSFMLSGQQRLLDRKVEEATRMIRLQRWLSRVSRDVFDESDFTMAVKTQLIYPSGPQVTVNGGNYRWETIQTVLRLVFSHLDVLERSYESSIQVVRRQNGGFPFIYFLRTDVQHALMQQIVADICSGRTHLLNIENFSASERQAIRAFITEANPQNPAVKCVSEIHKNSPADGYVIYLLRGLLVHRILILTLSRRWNVQYGLHPLRDPVSVPFLGKGIASNLAEWGHVDVSLLFTCLSFYYQGLAPAQLKQSLEQILKSDDPAREYEQWVQGSGGLSDRHRDWTSINLEDTTQLTEIWSAVRFNLTAIDHFLNNFVFPKHAKQFKVKLQASGWDLPLTGNGCNLTTGFSGTNDNRLVLPLNIKQDDMKGLAHTNAEVLCYLLHDRNRAYALAGFREDSGGRAVYRRMSEPDFLRKLRHKGIRVLIDAGALILEMTNFTLAKMWLDIDTEATAAVFFDDNNKPTVLTRSGRRTPLLASPYADDLSTCLVYLDESHTRGTDMKFPPKARGAVTLSLGQTKDHTVQAVMRLRQLATTQSITFFAPPEVHQSILDLRCKGDHSHLDSNDVVRWLLEQTCQGLENLQPLFYAQGVNYCQRIQAVQNNPQYLSNPAQRDAYLGALQDHEQQSLKSLYEPRTLKKKNRVKDEKFDGRIGLHIKELERRRKAFQDTGSAVHASALQEVEQEREVAVEAETIRERQKPVYFHPLTFSGLAHALREFVLSGALRLDDGIWESAFSYMKRSATGLKYSAELPASPQVLVSAEFRQAVIVPSGKVNDDFLRPVQWLLWSTTTKTAVLVSPEEAEELIPLCREAPKRVVHLLSYAAPVTQKMLQFNNLDYYAVPALPLGWSAPMWLRVQIGIFAGRLYFPFEELGHIRDFLGLGNDDPSNFQSDLAIEIEEERMESSSSSEENQTAGHDEPQILQDDKIITKEARAAKLKATRMLTFLHAWLGTRGRGQDFTHTPMGYICARKALTEDHPFFRSVDDDEARQSRVHHAVSGDASALADVGTEKDEDDHSDIDEEELDARHRLTEEELRLSTESAANGRESEDDDGGEDSEGSKSDSSDARG
ncbi:hypothetical protein PV04_06320 [Phialophora macrospora]|uniref:ubiquitinyl hydrolase 1 n=1 Tax=Phialophora macrospora TaxID=1851006 RepID=A0A0D2FG75_9EURO|nr:hypothetical protein PV04_06320 [Phialophora macrospora]